MRLTTTLRTTAQSKLQKEQQSSVTAAKPNMQHQQNPQIHYTGDFFVETISQLTSKERGSFVSESSFVGGNKLPISWFASTKQQNQQQHNGNNANWQIKNAKKSSGNDDHGRNNAFNNNEYLNSVSISDEELAVANAHQQSNPDDEDNTANEEAMPQEDVVDNAAATKNYYKRDSILYVKNKDIKRDLKNKITQAAHHNKMQQLQNGEEQQKLTADEQAHLRFKKSSLSAPLEAAVAAASKTKQRRKSTLSDNGDESGNFNICPDNKWQGSTQSLTNAAGGISTDSIGLWLMNELCEQSDIVEFR